MQNDLAEVRREGLSLRDPARLLHIVNEYANLQTRNRVLSIIQHSSSNFI